MKNFKYILILFLGTSLFVQACKKAGYFIYDDIDRIQFGPEQRLFYSQSSAYNDSLKSQTFAYTDVSKTIDTVYFDIYTMGDISGKERVFRLAQEIVPGDLNAVPGTHYKGFDDPDVARLYVIAPGQTHSRVPVILLRDSSLRVQNVVLKFKIIENENFKYGQKDLLWRKLVFTDKLSKPGSWNVGMLGKYSEVKHRFFIGITGQRWDDGFLLDITRDVQAQQYWLGIVQVALLAYNAEHQDAPLTDEDDELVIIP